MAKRRLGDWPDFKTGRLRIDKQVYSVNGRLEINEPKTKAAVRTVILPPAMVELLAEYEMQIFPEWMCSPPASSRSSPWPPAALKNWIALP